jgi:hypothetical protein
MFVCPAAVLVSAKLSAETAPLKTPEIDQTLVNLQTTMPLGRHRSYFRLTHRFARDLRQGDLGDLASDLFSLDNGAIIALEYRFAVTSRLQAGVHRTILGKTIVGFGRYDVWRQTDGRPFSVSGGLTYEGQNNLKQDYQPGGWATVSYTHGTFLALYASPTYVHNAHTETLRLEHAGHTHDVPGQDEDADHSNAIDTFYIGTGMRVRLTPRASFVAEIVPRVSGYKPAVADWNVGIEGHTRGHVFQLNFGNSFNTTPGQIARGGAGREVFMGFNISRKF